MSLIEDRSLGLVNLAIGVGGLLLALVALPAAIGYLFGQSIVIAILIGVIVGGVVLLMGGGFFFLRWHLNRPPYTLIAGEIDLRFHDPASGRATLVRTEKIQVNQRELGYIRIGRMISDGSIKNLHVDDKPIDEHQSARQEVESRLLYVVKDFHPPLMRGKTEVTTVSFDVFDAYKMNPAGLNYNVAPETKKLRMIVHFDPGKRCGSAQSFLRYVASPSQRRGL